MTAYEAWYVTKPHWDNFRVFGWDVYVVNESGSKNDLIKAKRHRFLDWSASTTTIHYLETNTNKIKRARHVYFDDFSSSTPLAELSPGAQIIRHEHTTTPPPVIEKVEVKKDTESILQIPSDDLKSTSSISLPLHCVPFTPRFDNETFNLHLRPDPHPFASNQMYEHTVDLPSASTHPFGILITCDDHFGLPFVKEIPIHSPWYVNLPAKFRRNIWVIGISLSEPITATSAYDTLQYHAKAKNELILPVVLCKWEPTPRTRLHQLRATFDQVHSNKKVATKLLPSGKYAIYCPTKPDTPSHFGKMLQSKLKIEWKKGIFEAYTKMQRSASSPPPSPLKRSRLVIES